MKLPPPFPALLNQLSRIRFSNREIRKLDIGPGRTSHSGFERLDTTFGKPTPHYLADAAKRLPFKDNTFDFIHASHILEHIPWYQSEKTIKEWIRILKPGGSIEIHVPDAEFIAKAFLEAESGNRNKMESDGQYRLNEEKDPSLWASYRTFAYGDLEGNTNHPNWHRALFSERRLMNLMHSVGLIQLERVDNERLLVKSHKTINLGIKGMKPNGV